jgi:predicted DNA-binding helix-hairpin-helix protein
MVSPARPNLDRQIDPKLAWALDHREQFPVDVNRAPREALLRVPGLGPRTVEQLLQTRRQRPIAAADLRRLRLNWYQVRYFVATSDHCPRQRVPQVQPAATSVDRTAPTGLPLFDAACQANDRSTTAA